MQMLSGRFEKTEAGRLEVAARSGMLNRSNRALLIMVDGQTTGEDLAARAHQIGLGEQAIVELVNAGFIRRQERAGNAPATEPEAAVPKPAMPNRKRSLAAARMYLMDIAARTFTSAEHPIRQRLVEATDRASVEGAFDALMAALREATSASMVEQVEVAFRGFLPAEEAVAG
ncbi:hypothetical protein ACN9M1_17540 [Ralstonia sp. R-29]|uniref:hypothetical protein n=1 Tax=Ralstonia sp. R-29 TaxID=3404059 RepID=UPI003CF8191C